MKNNNDLFELSVGRDLRVTNREGDRREFKQTYQQDMLPKLAKTMAAFSNKDGGVIVFGVQDAPKFLVGIDDNVIPDEAVFSEFLKEYFQPEIKFSFEAKDVKGKRLLFVLVHPSSSKPVVCKKKKTKRDGAKESLVLREGAIYFRYSATTDEIKYADLHKILESERIKFFRSMVDNISLINKVGIDKVAVVNAEQLAKDGAKAEIYITNEVAKNLNWIDSGRFVENEDEGEKAYYVMRRVEINQGIEVEKPVDFAVTHPLTKTELARRIRVNAAELDALTWRLGMKDNPRYHISSQHGKNKIHKYSNVAEQEILTEYPLDMAERKNKVKGVLEEYRKSQRV